MRGSLRSPGLVFPRHIFLEGRPTKHPAAQSRFRDALEHGGRPPPSQLKTDLHFRVRSELRVRCINSAAHRFDASKGIADQQQTVISLTLKFKSR
jgi:hypothetical protein